MNAGSLSIFSCNQEPMMAAAFRYKFLIQRRRINHMHEALPFMEKIDSIVKRFLRAGPGNLDRAISGVSA